MQITRTHLRVAVLLLLAAISFAGCGNRAAREEESAKKPAGRPTIVFMTDFGTANDAVAICRAVVVGIVPDVRIMDITHQVTPFSIEEGARFLAGPTPYYPAGTVFLGVVDPGVGTSRKAVIVKSKKEQYFVVPDKWPDHAGRGPRRRRRRPRNHESCVDDWRQGVKVPVKIEQKLYSFPYGKTFMDVPVGESLLYIDSRGRVGFAVNQGNFSRVYKITPPVSVLIARKKG